MNLLGENKKVKLLYGTGNQAKLSAMQSRLKRLDIELIGLNDLRTEGKVIPQVAEDGKSPLENAKLKAMAYYEAFHMPVFSCDSGLYFDNVPEDIQLGVHVRNVNGKCLSDSIYEYKKADIEDIDELVRTRIIVLRAANKLADDVDMTKVEQESYTYYRQALENGEHIAYLVYDDKKFIGAGGVSFYKVMPTYHNPTGKKAYIMNMYTNPEYRRKGVAFHTLDLLVKEAKKQGIFRIGLETTDMGQPLYEKYGFVKMEDEMELLQKLCNTQEN